ATCGSSTTSSASRHPRTSACSSSSARATSRSCGTRSRPRPSSGSSRCATCWAADGPGGGRRVYARPNLQPPGPIMKRNHRALAFAFVPLLALGQGLAGCAGDSPAPAALDEAALGAVAEQYVKLVLSLG